MVTGPSLQLIETIRNPTSLEEQIAALKQLKNDVTGHDQRKELVVKNGVVEPLVNVLSAATKSTGKRRRSRANGGPVQPAQAWTQEDEARLQATLILGGLASGGSAFVPPLLAAGTPKVLVDMLSTHAAPRLVTATLQALKNIASACSATQEGFDGTGSERLKLFTPASNDAFLEILRQPCVQPAPKQCLTLVADIIAIAATSETAKATLAHSQILDTLAALLASHAVANTHAVYADRMHLPPCPPANAIPSILSAISTIVSGSSYRVHRFFLSAPIRDLFLNTWSAIGDQRHLSGPRYGFATPYSGPLLPPLHIPTYGTTTYYGGSASRAFPAVASLQPHERRGIHSFDAVPQGGDADHANAVCSWLVHLARSMQGHSRLVALRLLALVHSAIDADVLTSGHRSEYVQKTKERVTQLALLAVPLAVTLVRTASEGKALGSSLSEQRDARLVKEEACEVLALLISHCKELQVAAVDAGAIKHVCPVLKKSFDNVPLAKPMWSAGRSGTTDRTNISETQRMGGRGLPPEILHAMRCRQGALEALAALAEKEDIHRKAIVEAGVMSCIIDSLKPFPPDFAEKLVSNRGQVGPKDGNTVPVMLAACHAAQAMSRSVSLLRTSLIDAGVAKPIVHLMTHADTAVQLAATDVCINLLIEFSPMRDDMLAEGVLRTLTEHARRSSPALRLSSLWALKHLVQASSKEVRINVLEELGTGWLVSAIQGKQREVLAGSSSSSASASAALSGGGVSVGLSTPNAAGEQVDLLNPSSMDVDEPATAAAGEDDYGDEGDDDDDDDEDGDDEDGEVMYDESSSTHYQASQLRSTLHPHPHPHPDQPPPPTTTGTTTTTSPSTPFNTKKYLSSVREAEQNPALQAKKCDIAVQEQALDFVRNLLNGEDCAAMTEHLLTSIGTSLVFDLLTAKLAPLPAAKLTGGGAGAGGGGGRDVYNPTDLILSTIHIINHLCNASPRHKQLVIAQKGLLQAWLPHFNHVYFKVRVMSVWAVNSLTWIEDESDRREARQRALELRALGVEAVVKGLVGDADLDVRERVKTAVRQFELLLP